MPSLGKIILLACMPAFVAGCAKYRPEPISAVAEAASLEGRTLTNPRLQEFIGLALLPQQTSVSTSWDLPKLTLAALYYHPDLDVARAKLASAQAGIVTAAQIPNPTVSASAIYNSTVTTPTPWTVGQVVNFLIETMGKREYRTAQAQNLADAARDDLATATWQVRGHVRTALLDLWAAQRRLALTSRRLTLQQQFVDLLQRRFAEGQTSALDMTRERINLNQSNLAVREAERLRAEARVQLATAVGVPVSALERVALAFNAFEHPVQFSTAIGELRRQALVYRSDVQALLAKYEATQSGLQLEIVRQFPNLNLGPGYTYDQGANKYNLDLAFDLPIFNQNQGPIAEADARRRGAAARFTALQAQVLGAIDAALASYRSGARAVATADKLAADGQHRQQEVSRSFGAGEVDRPTLVTAELEVAAIELSRFDAIAQRLQSLGALEDALQHLLFAPDAKLFVFEANPRTASEIAR